MRDNRLACDHCGKLHAEAELRALRRIEERVVDLKAGVEATPAARRGRAPWMASRRRDPTVLVRTPRYEYVQAGYRVCAAGLAIAQAEEQALARFHRRATVAVGAAAAVLAAVLISVWMIWPAAYAGLGLTRSAGGQPLAGAPPSSKPYKPPFDAATPVAQ